MIHSIDQIKIDVTYNNLQHQNKGPKLVSAKENLIDHSAYSQLEISPTGRELAAGAIIHHAAKYFGTVEINDTLNEVLSSQPEEISNAVYSIIQSNFINYDHLDSTDDERSALIELGLTQAQYISDHYMTGDDAKKFLSTMDKIAAIATTRKVDPTTNQVTYLTPPQRPKGAPEDYVSTSDLMKRFKPDTYKKLSDSIANGNDEWASILINFAKEVPKHPKWTKQYLDESKETQAILDNIKIDNRFKDADTTNIHTMSNDINNSIDKMSLENKALLKRNMEYFELLISGKIK